GRLALTAWDLPDRARFLGVLLEAVAAAGARPPSDIPTGPDFFRFSSEEAFGGLLRGAGLENVEVQTLAFSYPVASVEQLWDGLLGGTVRTSALILRQSRATRARIRAELDRLAHTCVTDDGLAVPVAVKLAAGRKPLSAGS